jgi:hypothetical protein
LAESEKDLKTLASRAIRYPHNKKSFSAPEQLFNQSFRDVLEKFIWDKIANRDSVSTMLTFLVSEKKPSDQQSNISVYLDICDWNSFPITSTNTVDFLNAVLIQTKCNVGNSNTNDAFGELLDGGDDTLPTITLQFIGKVGLRSMNHESPCQYRYGTIDAKSFPVGQESRKRAQSALLWLGNKDFEGQTWGRADIKELIFAYPAVIPKKPIKLIACFGTQQNDDSEARFANAAKDAIDGLKGISKDLRNLELRVFSLKKMDTTSSKTKVVFHRNYSAQRLIDAAKDWQDGAENIPIINILSWGEKKGEIISIQPEIPFPLQIAPCLNRVWKQDGKSECEALIIARSQGIELLLDEHPERFVPHLLSIALQNGKGLLLSLGSNINQGIAISIKGYDKHKLLIPSILGLLLHKLGIRKGSYMSNAPFLVGRMLKIADELHALYCKEVRKNNLPPQLLGNSLMTAALDSPNQALSLLSRRFLPYQAWARTNSSESAGLSRYFLKQFEEVELAGAEIPERLKDAERAQLLLGYLAANPKKSKETSEITPVNK